MSVVMEIVTDTSDDEPSIVGPMPDYTEQDKLSTPTSDLENSSICDDDYESRAEKMRELEDYVNATAAAMAKRTRRKRLRDSENKPSRKPRTAELSSDRYLKKIKTLQQNKRRQETRIKKLAKDVKILRDKINIQASYIDVLCGMLTPDVRERFRGRQGLGILGNTLFESNELDELPVSEFQSETTQEMDFKILDTNEDDDLMKMKEKELEYYCVEDLTDQQSDSKSVAVEGEVDRVSKDFKCHDDKKAHNSEMGTTPADQGCNNGSEGGIIPTESLLDRLVDANTPENSHDDQESLNTAMNQQPAEQPAPIPDESPVDVHVEDIKDDSSDAKMLGEVSTEDKTNDHQTDPLNVISEPTEPPSDMDSSCDHPMPDPGTPLPNKLEPDAYSPVENTTDENDLPSTSNFNEKEHLPGVLDSTEGNQENRALWKESSYGIESISNTVAPAVDGLNKTDVSQPDCNDDSKEDNSLESIIADYSAIESTTINEFLAEYAPTEESSHSKITPLEVSMGRAPNLSVPVVSIPPTSFSVPVVTVPPGIHISKTLPRVTIRGRRNSRRRRSTRTRPNIPALPNEQLIQQDFSTMTGISPLEFIAKYDIASNQNDFSQHYLGSTSTDNFQRNSLPVQGIPTKGATLEEIMADYQHSESLCISGLDVAKNISHSSAVEASPDGLSNNIPAELKRSALNEMPLVDNAS